MNKKEMINAVYQELKDRRIHPQGKFDNAGRFYLTNSKLVDVREPSRAYPYSQMKAGRTRKYVAAVAEAFSCETVEDLKSRV